MADLNSSLGNVVTRLGGGLRKISSKRVMPGAEFLEDLDNYDTDVSGTAQELPNFANFLPPSQNQPESDLGGELTAQSYDVRANVANPPPQDEGMGSTLRKLGASLWDSFKQGWTPGIDQSTRERMGIKPVAQTPPVETTQVDVAEGIPPVTASQEQAVATPERAKPPEASPGFWGAVSDWWSPTKSAQMREYNNDLLQDAQLRAQGKNPDEVRAQHQQQLQQGVEKAMEQPWQYSAYGSAQEVANHPALQQEFKEVTGMDFEPQIAAQVSEYEEAMQGVEDALNGINTELSANAESIKNRILNNQSTNADNLYIGLALLMPLLIGGIFGKQAGLGALAGASQGFANVLGNREKSVREDEESLREIAKQQAGNQEKLATMGLEKAKLGPALRKLLPEDPNKAILGMKAVEWTDPATGKQEMGVRIKPGFIARKEFVNSDEGRKDMLKAANELSEVKSYVDDVDDLTNDIAEIVSQLKDPSSVWKGFTQILTHTSPSFLAKVSQDVMFDGRKQNAGTLLEEKLGFLANKYGQAQQLGQLDRAAQNHIKKIIDNPTNSFISPQDSLNQILEVRKLAQRGLVSSAANKGFIPEFVVAELEGKNNELFGRLNQGEQQNRADQIKKKLLQSETNYAQ